MLVNKTSIMLTNKTGVPHEKSNIVLERNKKTKREHRQQIALHNQKQQKNLQRRKKNLYLEISGKEFFK